MVRDPQRLYHLTIGPIEAILRTATGAPWIHSLRWKELENALSFLLKNIEYSPRYEAGWDGRQDLYRVHGGDLFFPSGLAPKVMEVLIREIEGSSCSERIRQVFFGIDFKYPQYSPKGIPMRALGGGKTMRAYQKYQRTI